MSHAIASSLNQVIRQCTLEARPLSTFWSRPIGGSIHQQYRLELAFIVTSQRGTSDSPSLQTMLRKQFF